MRLSYLFVQAALETCLKTSGKPEHLELLVMHYLQRGRHVEAIRLNEEINEVGSYEKASTDCMITCQLHKHINRLTVRLAKWMNRQINDAL